MYHFLVTNKLLLKPYQIILFINIFQQMESLFTYTYIFETRSRVRAYKFDRLGEDLTRKVSQKSALN